MNAPGTAGTFRRASLGWLVAVLLTVGPVAAACGDDDDGDPAATGSERSQVAEAQRITEAATTGLVWAEGERLLAPADIVEMDGWNGPTTSPEAEGVREIQVIACVTGTACEDGANTLQDAAEQFDWNVEVTASLDGTPNSYPPLMDTAIGKRPDAIVLIGVADVLVAPQIERARDLGIQTIGVAAVQTGEVGYDSYIDNRSSFQTQLLVHAIVADAEGEANTVIVNNSTNPIIQGSTDDAVEVLDQCVGCDTTVVEMEFADFVDPVRADAQVTAILQANPEAEYLIWPFDSLGLGAAVEAVRKLGADDRVEIATKDATPAGLAFVGSGDVWLDAGISIDWAALATLDELRRGFSGEPFLTTAELGLPAHLFTEGNAPADASGPEVAAAYEALFDYQAEYAALWGLS
jgi:ABC-type sugar transport system substrate-binding protein